MEEELPYRFVAFPGKYAPEGYEEEYLSAYDTFRKVWATTMREVNGTNEFYSDDYTRQDYILALFRGNFCVALDCLRAVDLNRLPDQHDSLLRSWKADLLEKIVRDHGGKCLVNSRLAVLPEFRKTLYGGEIPVSYILLGLSVLFQLEMGYQIMIGTARNERSMNSLAQLWGGVSVESNVQHNSSPSDLILFVEKDIRKAEKKFPAILFELFKSMENSFRGKKYEVAA